MTDHMTGHMITSLMSPFANEATLKSAVSSVLEYFEGGASVSKLISDLE